jgi:hypothetical protein
MADDLSRRQSKEERSNDGRVGMHGASNSAYYRNRERAERMQATQAGSDKIRQIHLAMAERYRELARKADSSAGEPPFTS